MAAEKRIDKTAKLYYEVCGWVLYQLYKKAQPSEGGVFSLFFDIETGGINMHSYADSSSIVVLNGWYWINVHNFFFDIIDCIWEPFFTAIRKLYIEGTPYLINPMFDELSKMKTIENMKLYIDMNG